MAPESKGLEDIADRGDTWPQKPAAEKVSDQLRSLFVNPALRPTAEPHLEPELIQVFKHFERIVRYRNAAKYSMRDFGKETA